MRLPSWAWERIRRRILERDGYRCRECGRAGGLEVDHVRRVIDGGGDADDNLQALCRGCHIRKTQGENAKIPRDWEKRATADRLVRELT